METKAKSSTVDAIDNRIDPGEPEQYITVPFEYFITDSSPNWFGKTTLLIRLNDPFSNQPIQLSEPTVSDLININDEERLERFAKHFVKEYVEFHTNLS